MLKPPLKIGSIEGIDLQKDTYQLEYATDPTNQHAHYDEYYWIGLYFTTWDAHLSLFNPSNNFENPKYPPPNFDPDDQRGQCLEVSIQLQIHTIVI